jgi:hypothetical protein
MSSVNIGGGGFGKSSKNLKKDSSQSRSKSPTKDKCSFTKIDVIEEVRESRDGLASSALENNNFGPPAFLNRDSNLTPARERADTVKSNSPFRINPRNADNRPLKIKKKVKKNMNVDHEVPAYIKKSPRW